MARELNGDPYVSVIPGRGGPVPLSRGDLANTVSFLNPGGIVWIYKPLGDLQQT